MTPLVGMITIGQAPRVDVVPDMVEIIGPGIRIREVGALDGLSREAIAALAPAPGDDILVTRLADGQSVFVAKHHVVARVQACVDELEAAGVAMTAILCTGVFPPLRARRPLVEPQEILLGLLRGLTWEGRLGVLTPSVRHVPQTEARWREVGFDAAVVPLSPTKSTIPRPSLAPPRRSVRVGSASSSWTASASAARRATCSRGSSRCPCSWPTCWWPASSPSCAGSDA